MAERAVPNVEKRNACKILVGKLGRKEQLARRRLLCEGTIKIDLKATGWEDVR